MKTLFTSILCILLSIISYGQEKVNINQSMITDEKNYPYSSPYKMFDEQSNITSENQLNTKPITKWGDYQEAAKYYPLSAVIDLQADINISSIYIFDNNGISDLDFYFKNGNVWELLFTDKLQNYQTWNKHIIGKKIRYVKIVSKSPDGNFGEVVFFKSVDPIVVIPPVIPPVVGSQIKLSISSDMIIDEKANPQTSPYTMFDEQDTIKSLTPSTQPKTSWGSYLSADLYYPLSSVIDLGQLITISTIYIYDSNGSTNLTFYALVNNVWELVFIDKLTSYNTWNKHTCNKTTQYIKIVSDAPGAVFNEVIIYGNKQTIKPTKTILQPKEFPLFEDFLGINILHTNPIQQASIVKNIREFHLWTWNEANTNITNYPGYPANKYGFNPSPGTYWNFDGVYSSYKNKGLKIIPVLQGTAFWFNNGLDGTKQDFKPVLDGKNPEDPASYIAHADYLYQFTARYGNKINYNLKVQSDNQPLSGLNLISGVENWNEPNKTWKTRKGLFTPYEYAAMTSADYDGHQGKLGATLGVKNADPSMPFIMAGLTGMDTVYTRSMLYWFKTNRSGSIPLDVINYHHYSNDAGGQIGSPTFGISPEADQLERKVKAVVDFNRRNLPGKPVWITEYGFDVAQSSSQKAKTYGTYTGEDIQAMWLVRSSLAFYTGGADKAYIFWLEDDDSRSPYIFGTSGILSNIPGIGIQPRKSYYWLATMNSVLGKYRLTQKTELNGYHTAVFNRPTQSDTTIICLWSGTETSRSTPYIQYISESNAVLIQPKIGSLTGIQTKLPVVDGRVALTVSEDPIYLKVWGKNSVVNARLEFDEERIKFSDIHIFPNPSNGQTHIISDGFEMINSILVFNTQGLLVKSNINLFTNNFILDTQTLKAGVYNIQILTIGSSKPIIKQLVVVK